MGRITLQIETFGYRLYTRELIYWALSFCMEKPVVPVINQMERTFPPEKGIPSEVLLFSRFHRNDRKILFHLRRFNSSMLPGELNARLNAPGKHGIRVYMSK